MREGAAPEFEVRTADWLSVAEAQRRILEAVVPLPEERVPLTEAAGRALAEELRADATLPPWDNAGMDGYAVRSDDVRGASPARPVPLRVRGLVRAGEAPAHPIEAGEAIRIMTGAPVPEGADSVVRVEDTDAESTPGTVRILRDRDARANVRPAGQDMQPGDRVLREGATLRPGTVGVAAALGRSTVVVRRRPVVAILTTGDELRTAQDHDHVRAGLGIPDSNGPMLAAAVGDAGGIPLLTGIVPDAMEALEGALGAVAGADVLVTVGGASMGEADLVKRALDAAGFQQDFWRVRMRPGSPFGFGRLPRAGRAQPVFGLPGNPASAFVTFEVFVRPFLLAMAGHAAIHRPRLRCRAGEPFTGQKRTLFVRVRLEHDGGAPKATMTGPQGSGLVRGLGEVDGLAIVPAGKDLGPGDPVEVLLLDGARSVAGPSSLEGLDG